MTGQQLAAWAPPGRDAPPPPVETIAPQRSDWLTFLRPIGSGSPDALSLDLGSPVIPLPLRAYPPLPILVDHRAVVPLQAETLDEAVR